MDYSNMDISHIYLKLTNFSVLGDTINASIPMLMAQERMRLKPVLFFRGVFSFLALYQGKKPEDTDRQLRPCPRLFLQL